jgi:dephospho-CoA kinase
MENSDMEYSNSGVVGITGGIGTGKSTVAKLIAGMGYPMISTDELAKDVMKNDKNVIKALKATFGDSVYRADGTPDSDVLASLIFGGDEESDKNMLLLNSIVHPPVIEILSEKVADLEDDEAELIFVECALIFESGIEEDFDFIITVDAPEDAVVERVTKRSGLAPEQVKARIAAQMPNKEKIAVSDFVIDNKGTLDELKKSVEMVVEVVKSLAGMD